MIVVKEVTILESNTTFWTKPIKTRFVSLRGCLNTYEIFSPAMKVTVKAWTGILSDQLLTGTNG